MGISPLPTATQRNNEKSGVALEKIETAEAIGSSHFRDNLDRSLAYAGRVIIDWLKVTETTEQEVALRKPDDTHQVVRINTAQPWTDDKGEEHHYPIAEDKGDYDVTISAGPSFQSQREAASKFLDTLIASLKGLPVAPPQAAKLLALAIQMKQLGPKGDEMAEIISPTDKQQDLPPQALQAIHQAQTHLQAMNAYAQQLEAQIKELQQEKQAKVVDNEYRLRINHENNETKLAVAEVGTKMQQMSERIAAITDLMQQWHSQAHDLAMQKDQQAHQAGMAEQAAANQAAQPTAQPGEAAAGGAQ